MSLIFDVDGAPVSDNEYQARLLAITIQLVQAAGGKLRIPPATQQQQGMTFLYQDVQEDGSLLLSVETTPRPTQEA